MCNLGHKNCGLNFNKLYYLMVEYFLNSFLRGVDDFLNLYLSLLLSILYGTQVDLAAVLAIYRLCLPCFWASITRKLFCAPPATSIFFNALDFFCVSHSLMSAAELKWGQLTAEIQMRNMPKCKVFHSNFYKWLLWCIVAPNDVL